MSNIVSLAISEMSLTEESLKILRENKKRISKVDTDNLECTIKIQHSTVEALKELSYQNRFDTYDQLIQTLLRSYKKYNNKDA